MRSMICEGCGKFKNDVSDYMIQIKPLSFTSLTTYLCKECSNKKYDDLVTIAIKAWHKRKENGYD